MAEEHRTGVAGRERTAIWDRHVRRRAPETNRIDDFRASIRHARYGSPVTHSMIDARRP